MDCTGPSWTHFSAHRQERCHQAKASGWPQSQALQGSGQRGAQPRSVLSVSLATSFVVQAGPGRKSRVHGQASGTVGDGLGCQDRPSGGPECQSVLGWDLEPQGLGAHAPRGLGKGACACVHTQLWSPSSVLPSSAFPLCLVPPSPLGAPRNQRSGASVSPQLRIDLGEAGRKDRKGPRSEVRAGGPSLEDAGKPDTGQPAGQGGAAISPRRKQPARPVCFGLGQPAAVREDGQGQIRLSCPPSLPPSLSWWPRRGAEPGPHPAASPKRSCAGPKQNPHLVLQCSGQTELPTFSHSCSPSGPPTDSGSTANSQSDGVRWGLGPAHNTPKCLF